MWMTLPMVRLDMVPSTKSLQLTKWLLDIKPLLELRTPLPESVDPNRFDIIQNPRTGKWTRYFEYESVLYMDPPNIKVQVIIPKSGKFPSEEWQGSLDEAHILECSKEAHSEIWATLDRPNEDRDGKWHQQVGKDDESTPWERHGLKKVKKQRERQCTVCKTRNMSIFATFKDTRCTKCSRDPRGRTRTSKAQQAVKPRKMGGWSPA